MEKFNMMNAFLMLSDMDTEQTPKQKAKTKERIVFATMRSEIPQWQPPQNWDNLPPEERLNRLESIQKEFNKLKEMQEEEEQQ